MRIVLLSLVLFASSLFAVEKLDTDGLSAEQKAKIQLQIEQMKRDEDKTKTIDVAKEYVQLGEMIGKAFGSCAKELNVQVNDFITTPAGMLTISIICWKTIGRDMVHFGFGFLVLVVGSWFWYICAYRPLKVASIEYGQGFWIFRSRKVTLKKDSEISDGWAAATVIFILIIVVMSQIIMWS